MPLQYQSPSAWVNQTTRRKKSLLIQCLTLQAKQVRGEFGIDFITRGEGPQPRFRVQEHGFEVFTVF